VDPEIMGYVEAWINFLIGSEFVPSSIEQIVFHEQLQYAGRLDRIGSMYQDKTPWVIDIKTGPCKPWHGVQLAAYAACLDQPHRRAVVQLLPNGIYKVHEFKDRNDWKLFQACLSVWNARQAGAQWSHDNEPHFDSAA
jgi:hypothetical protein